jgi:hypothetical protein
MIEYGIIGFLLFTGFLFIMTSIQDGLGDDKKSEYVNTSSVNFKYFGLKGPTKLIFGIALFVIGFYLIGSIKQKELKNNTILFQREKDSLISIIENKQQIDSTYLNTKFTSLFVYNEPKSIFNGKILITSASGGILDSASLTFIGIKGVSKQKIDSFYLKKINVSKGQRMYILLEDSTRWGLNILDLSRGINIEFFKL